MEALRGMRSKLRMMGVPLSGTYFSYGYNMSVIHNTQRPKSVLKKKSNSICYHICREAVAMHEMITGYVQNKNNPADTATKVLGGGAKRNGLISHLLNYLTEIVLEGPNQWILYL